ncbi:hypothetical protein ACJX0J_029005, partial [Zea mays]
SSLAQGHPTLVLLWPEIGQDIGKLQMLPSFEAQGARLVEASLEDHAGLLAAVAQADLVVSAMSGAHICNHNLSLQHKLVKAIKEAGNIKDLICEVSSRDTGKTMYCCHRMFLLGRSGGWRTPGEKLFKELLFSQFVSFGET